MVILINAMKIIKVVYEDYENYGYSDLFIYKLPWDKTKYIIEDFR